MLNLVFLILSRLAKYGNLPTQNSVEMVSDLYAILLNREQICSLH